MIYSFHEKDNPYTNDSGADIAGVSDSIHSI